MYTRRVLEDGSLFVPRWHIDWPESEHGVTVFDVKIARRVKHEHKGSTLRYTPVVRHVDGYRSYPLGM